MECSERLTAIGGLPANRGRCSLRELVLDYSVSCPANPALLLPMSRTT
jgi:hypothetical protein